MPDYSLEDYNLIFLIKMRLYILTELITGCATWLWDIQRPFEKPFPSLSVAPKISNF